MKKILLGLFALSAMSFGAVHETTINQAVELDIGGTISVKADAVIPANKIVIYKDGNVNQGADGINFGFNVQQGQPITKAMTLNKFYVKEVPATGLTEDEIRTNANINVPMARIRVGFAKTGTPNVSTALTAAPLGYTLSGLGYAGAQIGTTTQLKIGYDATNKIVEFYLDGRAGTTPGDLVMSGKIGIKVVS